MLKAGGAATTAELGAAKAVAIKVENRMRDLNILAELDTEEERDSMSFLRRVTPPTTYLYVFSRCLIPL